MINITKLFMALAPDILAALANDEHGDTPDETILQAALNVAEEAVRAELARGGYQEDATLTEWLEDIAVSLAVDRLFERRRENLSPTWRERAERGRRLLEDVGNGHRTIHGVPRAPQVVVPDSSNPLHRLRTMKRL